MIMLTSKTRACLAMTGALLALAACADNDSGSAVAPTPAPLDTGFATMEAAATAQSDRVIQTGPATGIPGSGSATYTGYVGIERAQSNSGVLAPVTIYGQSELTANFATNTIDGRLFGFVSVDQIATGELALLNGQIANGGGIDLDVQGDLTWGGTTSTYQMSVANGGLAGPGATGLILFGNGQITQWANTDNLSFGIAGERP
jgi:hypothetical protein